MLIRKRSTPNGVFGLKLGWTQLGLLIEEGVAAELLADFRWIYLRRRNLVAQAVSLYKARTSGAYQRRLTDSTELRDGFDRLDAQSVYDGSAIGRYLAEIVEGEEAAEATIANWRLVPLRLVYEDMLAGDPASAVDAVHRLVFDGTPAPKHFKPSNIERSGTPKNQEFESRFRKEHGRLIDALEGRRRPLVHGIR
jgi:LPS sulfotransferase NodH